MQLLVKWANSLMRFYLSIPTSFRWLVWLLPIIYFVMPFDLDVIRPIGYFDDILLMWFCYWAFGRAAKFSSFYKEAHADEDSTAFDYSQQTAHEILEVARDASAAEMKKSYRRLLSMYHPDKFTHLGRAFEATAERRTRAIIDAYQQLNGK